MFRKKYSPKYIVELARDLRSNMTPAEIMVWEALCKKQVEGFRFKRQYPIGRYIADFYCHELKLIIEIDGDIHNTRNEYDKNRDQFLEADGYTVLRFSNDKIIDSIDSVINTIKQWAYIHRKQ